MRHLWKSTRDGREGHFCEIDKSHGAGLVSVDPPRLGV